MHITLIIHPEKLEHYGDIPYHSSQSEGNNEIYYPSIQPFDDLDTLWPVLYNDFVVPIMDPCDMVLSLGDPDYFDTEHCKLLAAWLRERMKRPVPPILQDFYEKLLEYAERAIELGTGVVVEL